MKRKMNQNKANIFEIDLSKYVFKNNNNTGRKEIMKVMLLMKMDKKMTFSLVTYCD